MNEIIHLFAVVKYDLAQALPTGLLQKQIVRPTLGVSDPAGETLHC